jgi:hypothetical protein
MEMNESKYRVFHSGITEKSPLQTGNKKRGFESRKDHRVGLDRERAADESPAGEICPDGQIKTTG